MDYERIQLLLDIVHKTLNVPGTEKIRAEALRELYEHSKDMHRMEEDPSEETSNSTEEDSEDEPTSESNPYRRPL